MTFEGQKISLASKEPMRPAVRQRKTCSLPPECDVNPNNYLRDLKLYNSASTICILFEFAKYVGGVGPSIDVSSAMEH